MTRQHGDSGALGLILSSAATHVLSNSWRRCIQVQCFATAVTSAATDQRGSEQRLGTAATQQRPVTVMNMDFTLSPSISTLTP